MNRHEYVHLGKYLGAAPVAASPVNHHRAMSEELKAAYQRITELEADLVECREYIERDMDVVDGDYGEQSPNRAMQLVSMIDESLHGPGAF